MSSTRMTRTRRLRRIALPVACAAVSAGALALTATGAVFTDTKAVAGNAFADGTLLLNVTPSTSAFHVPNMAPGDIYTAPVTVKNAGSMSLRYAMTSTATGGLTASLTLAVKTGVTDCSNTGYAASGSSLHTQAAPVGTSTGMPVFGDSQTGPDAGDRVLASGVSDVLCVQVTLPTEVGNAVAGQSASISFGFVSEQVTPIAPPTVTGFNSSTYKVAYTGSATPGISQYALQTSTDGGKAWVNAGTVNATTSPLIFPSAGEQFRMQSVAAEGETSAWSEVYTYTG